MATNNKPTPADRIRKVHEAIMRAKLTIPYDHASQAHLSAALHCAEQAITATTQTLQTDKAPKLFHDGGTD